MKLKDKVALITGGARGIGKAVALAYAHEGARLAICARTESEINETVQEIQKLKADAKGWSCDVSIAPALFTNTSMRPNFLIASPTKSLTESSMETSQDQPLASAFSF